MKLLAFLGLYGGYQPVEYAYRDQRCETMFSTIAACQFLAPGEVIVFLTPQAKEQTYPIFKTALSSSSVKIKAVDIPIGEDEDQLWDLFSIITQQVIPGEEVAFDITNGLRSFPLVGLLAAAFLHAAAAVTLKAVLYGAFDISRLHEEAVVPMFDLSPMITLFDWTLAAERFTQYGDSEYMADLLEVQKNELAKAAQGDKARLADIGEIGRLASTMQNISQALDLIRPVDVFQEAAQLENHIISAQTVLQAIPQTQPSLLLLDHIQGNYQRLKPESDHPSHLLQKQIELVNWYLEHKYWVHTVTLAREVMVNWFMHQSGIGDWWDKTNREQVESQINIDARQYRDAKQKQVPVSLAHFSGIDNIEAVLDTWNRLADIRNDIDHAGHRKNPVSARNLMTNIKTVIAQVGEGLNA